MFSALPRTLLRATIFLISLGVGFWGIDQLNRSVVQPLRVGSNVWPGYEPLYLARKMGLYRDRGIHLVELLSASDVLLLFRSGNLEAAALTLDEVLTLLQDGLDLRVLLVMDSSAGGDVLLARPDIVGLADLKGKTIAVENSAVGAILLDGALAKAGLPVADVKLISLTVDQHLAAYTENRVDAVVTFEPISSRLQQAGAKILFDSSQIPGQILDVLVVRTEALEKHKSQLETLVAGYFQAVAHLRDHPQVASEQMTGRLRLSPAEIVQSFRGLELPDLRENRALLQGEVSLLQKIALDLADFMTSRKLLDRPVEFTVLTDPRFLPEDNP